MGIVDCVQACLVQFVDNSMGEYILKLTVDDSNTSGIIAGFTQHTCTNYYVVISF